MNQRLVREVRQDERNKCVNEFEKMIDNFGESRCGFMDSIEGCNRIDREELRQSLQKWEKNNGNKKIT